MVKTLPIIKHISQKHTHGCAIASMAIVMGMDYDLVMKKSFPNWKDFYYFQDLGLPDNNCRPALYTSQMIKVIRSCGFSVKKSYGFDFGKQRAILFIDLSWGSAQDTFHCIVYDPAFGGRLIDPAFRQSEGKRYYMERWKKANKETLIIT